ncbi:MAG: hypothetical protein J6M53_03010 [Bacteroidaceae bacterium]|nr:hypothetical protein [Bacteroidaceae bacterium]
MHAPAAHAVTDGVECGACLSNQPHAGHLSQSTPGIADCVVCQFLSLQYLPGSVSVAAAPATAFAPATHFVVSVPVRRLFHLPALRAPPGMGMPVS